MPRSSLIWVLVLVIGGSAAVAACVATAPAAAAGARRDFFDSPFLLLAFAALAILAGLAGWLVPQVGFLWGLLAAAPFFVYFAVGVIGDRGNGDEGLWPVGLLFLIGLTLVPVIAALVTSLIARAR